MTKNSSNMKTQSTVAVLAIVMAFVMCTVSQAGISVTPPAHGPQQMPESLIGMPKGSPVPVDPNCPMPFPEKNLCAALVFATPATVGPESIFQVEFHNRTTGAPEDPEGEVGVFLWMEMMDHGSSPVAIAHTKGSGVYLVTKAYFLMRGEWDVHVTIESENLNEEAITAVSL
jgi:hypothetical protein